MLKRFKLLSLAAFVIAAALSSCQKQEMDSFSNEAVSSDGTRASSFSSKYGIDWGKVTKKYCSSSYPAFYSMQATADKDNVYLLLRAKPGEMKKGHAYDNELSVFVYDKSNGSTRYWNDQKSTRVDAMGGWLMKDSNPKFTSWNDKVSSQAVTYDGYYYYEIRYPRSISSLLKGNSIKIGVRMENNYKRSNGTYASSSDVKVIGILPSKGSDMYSVGSSSSNGNTASTSTLCSNIGTTPMLVGYVRLSAYDESKDYSKMTHIIAYNAVPVSTSDHNIKIKADNDSERKTKINNLKKLVANKVSGQKVLLLVGGAGAKGFKEIATGSSDAIETFCSSCAQFVKDYKLDGIDLDWEHPSSSSDKEKNGLNTIVQVLREKLGNGKIISLSVSSNPKHYNLKGLLENADFLNVMTYDLNWRDYYAYHHSALYPSKSNYTTSDVSNSCSSSLKAYLSVIGDNTKNRQRLNMGVAFYGRGTSAYDSGNGVKYKDYRGNYQKSNSYKWDSASMVPYVASNGGFFGFENVYSVNIKGQYAKKNNLLGVMFWEFSQDKNHELFDALRTGLNGTNIGGKSDQPYLSL